ncbi:MAG: response regulator transcription factor [Flavobacteriia bacterium]|nr:response regulator transcription factor [Flavobacteriia bacterium]
MQQYKVIIADDHQLIIDGIISLLENENEFKIIAGVINGKELIEKTKLLIPDIVITDIDMPIMSGEEAVKILRKEFPDLKILVLSMHKDLAKYALMKVAGANGFIHKNTDKEELIFALRQLIKGKEYVSSEINTENIVVKKETSLMKVDLTKREIEIIQYIALGLSNNEIGTKLFISARTVDTHRTNIMRKINVNNVAGLIRFAYTSKIIEN